MAGKSRHYLGRLADVLIGAVAPQRWRVPLQFHKQTLLLDWEPEARLIRRYARKGPVAVDVGGNQGLWSYAMVASGLFERVVCLEPNARLTADLESMGLPGLEVLHRAASSAVGTSRLRIPRHNNMSLHGWASLEDHIDVDTDEFEELVIQTIRLDDLELRDVGFVKIDVEGHELSLLEGARNLFTESRPVCMIECRDRNLRQVEAYFSQLRAGYQLVDTRARFGFELSTGNNLFAPA